MPPRLLRSFGLGIDARKPLPDAYVRSMACMAGPSRRGHSPADDPRGARRLANPVLELTARRTPTTPPWACMSANSRPG